jgi:hypothetical protein
MINRVIFPFRGSRQRWRSFSLPPGFNQSPRDITRDLQRFRNGPPLRYQPLQFIGCCQKYPFGQLLNSDVNS